MFPFKHLSISVAAVSMWASASVFAQQAEFPAGATTPDVAQLKQYMNNRVFTQMGPNGATGRLEYKDNGYFYWNSNQGQNASGTWTASDGSLCGQIANRPNACSTVRLLDGILHYRRENGEIHRLIPR
jgi:Protein of unknown function (DUF995)